MNKKKTILSYSFKYNEKLNDQKKKICASSFYFKNLKFAIFISLLFSTQSIVTAQCPNKCSGRGICNSSVKCECYEGFQGGDCSERSCPMGTAFSDSASSTNVAHHLQECSGRGICDKKTGLCECMQGFTGIACERTTCANKCSNKGRCVSYRQMAVTTLNSKSEKIRYDNVWDADKIYGCICDEGYSGFDCSISTCPSGDDPLTPGGDQEKQLLHCNATTGSFVLYFDRKQSKTIDVLASKVEMKKAIESIPGLGTVSVEFSFGDYVCNSVNRNIVSITFIDLFGPLPPLVSITLGLNEGAVVEIGSNDLNGMMTDDFGNNFVAVKGSKENDECSNRGICDEGTGMCRCFYHSGDVYAGSDGYGNPGDKGDCGYPVATIEDCPGETPCSGHGICDQTTKRCICEENFYGGDCSLRKCSFGWSWFSYPSDEDVGHDEWSLCSNMGICDRTNGDCTCNDGFFGSACEYMSCGGSDLDSCSGHGTCLSMKSLAKVYSTGGVPSPQAYGVDPNDSFTWDANRIFGCYCDDGYGGYDCSLRTCPSDSNGYICSGHGLCDENKGICNCFHGWGGNNGVGGQRDCSTRLVF